MKIKEPEVMMQLYKIKEELSEELIHLTPKERIEKIRGEAEAFLKEHGGDIPKPDRNFDHFSYMSKTFAGGGNPIKLKEPEVMRMLHKIREEMYEEMKDLSPREWVEKIHKEAEAFMRKSGLKEAKTSRKKKQTPATSAK